MSLFTEPPRRPGTDESGAGDREEFDAAATPSQGGETPRSVVVSGRVFMGPSAAPVASVLDLIELAYAAPTAHAKVCQVLDRLSEFVPFASAVWLPVDDELELAAGYQVGCSADEVAIYLRDHAASDPFLRVAPCPDQLNVPVHLNTVGAVAAGRTTLPGALAHPHALGILAGSLGHAVAFVRLQRTADHGKFTRAEAATAKQVLHHLARAVLAQRVLGKGTAHLHSAMLVFADDGRLLYQTEGARRILRALPPGKILDFVNQRRQVLALIGGRAYRAKTLVPSHRSLLARFVQPHPGPAKGDDRGFPAKLGATVVIQLAAAQARRDVPERMRRMRLSVREIEVALMLLPGYPVAQIAARCGVHLQTAKEHVSAIYRKSGTASRAEFVAAVFGLKAALVD